MKKQMVVLLILVGMMTLLPGEEQERVRSAGGGIVMQLPENVPLAALTFDDGPNPVTTARLLEGLALREVTATFFVVGSRVEEHPELVKEMVQAGHQVGVHTYDHVMLTQLTPEVYQQQVERARAQLEGLLGEKNYMLRPPYGLMDERLSQLEQQPLIIWSVDPEDWKDRNTQRVVEEVLAKVEDGAVILLHDIYEESVDAALSIVDEMLSRGYCFVTVEQLATLRGIELKPGQRYTEFPPSGEE